MNKVGVKEEFTFTEEELVWLIDHEEEKVKCPCCERKAFGYEKYTPHGGFIYSCSSCDFCETLNTLRLLNTLRFGKAKVEFLAKEYKESVKKRGVELRAELAKIEKIERAFKKGAVK